MNFIKKFIDVDLKSIEQQFGREFQDDGIPIDDINSQNIFNYSNVEDTLFILDSIEIDKYEDTLNSIFLDNKLQNEDPGQKRRFSECPITPERCQPKHKVRKLTTSKQFERKTVNRRQSYPTYGNKKLSACGNKPIILSPLWTVPTNLSYNYNKSNSLNENNV